jgi:hypothetical protein
LLDEILSKAKVVDSEASAESFYRAVQSWLELSQPKVVTNESSAKLAALVLKACSSISYPGRVIALNATSNTLEWPETDFYIDGKYEELLRELFILGYSAQALEAKHSFLLTFSGPRAQHFLAGVAANLNLSSKMVQLLEKEVKGDARGILAANPSLSSLDVQRLLEVPIEEQIVAAMFSRGAVHGIDDWRFVFQDLIWTKGDFYPSKEFFEEVIKSICSSLEDEVPESYRRPAPVDPKVFEILIGDDVMVDEWWDAYNPQEDFVGFVMETPPNTFVQYYCQDAGFKALVDSCSWEPILEWIEHFSEEIEQS